MPTSYTSSLGLALPVTGELSGTWGDVVNNYITSYVDSAVAGAQTISGSQTAVTLSTTNGTALSQAGSGATGSAQYMIINCTGNPASTLTITAPATSKAYIVINATSTSQSVKIVGTGPTTGVTIATGQRALVAWNGSDFVQVGASAGGSNTQVQYNSSGALAGSANLTFNGTRLTAADFSDSSLTSGRITTAGAGGNLQDSANLTWDGTNVQIGAAGALRFANTGNTFYVAFKGPTGTAANVTWTLPSVDGTANQVLQTNGSGTLSWATPSAGISQAKVTGLNFIFSI